VGSFTSCFQPVRRRARRLIVAHAVHPAHLRAEARVPNAMLRRCRALCFGQPFPLEVGLDAVADLGVVGAVLRRIRVNFSAC
jgi:hypothetical protein